MSPALVFAISQPTTRGLVSRHHGRVRHSVWITLVGLAIAAGTACGEERVAPTATETSTSAPTGSTVVAQEASFVLTVTNQSRRDPSASIEVLIDGRRYIEGTFAVATQHNFYDFPFDLPPGVHTLTARTNDGVEHTETFDLPERETRYGVLYHWGADWGAEGPGPFQWQFQEERPAFG